MRILDTDQVVCFDVDDTLILYDKPDSYADSDAISIGKLRVWPHRKHIETLRQFKARGQNVVVWSAGGKDWAAEVVYKLMLGDYVDLIMCKPKWYFDDLPAKEWLGKWCYHNELGQHPQVRRD